MPGLGQAALRAGGMGMGMGWDLECRAGGWCFLSLFLSCYLSSSFSLRLIALLCEKDLARGGGKEQDIAFALILHAMSSFTSVRRALSAAILLIAFAIADQQCYYPDGTPSDDTPCGGEGASSCCGEGSFCMDNGLCFGGGLVSRGSCTDKSWESAECTGFCKTGKRCSSREETSMR